MCDDFKDVEANRGIGCESSNRDPWNGWASKQIEDENGEATKSDKELERNEPLMMGDRK